MTSLLPLIYKLSQSDFSPFIRSSRGCGCLSKNLEKNFIGLMVPCIFWQRQLGEFFFLLNERLNYFTGDNSYLFLVEVTA